VSNKYKIDEYTTAGRVMLMLHAAPRRRLSAVDVVATLRVACEYVGIGMLTRRMQTWIKHGYVNQIGDEWVLTVTGVVAIESQFADRAPSADVVPVRKPRPFRAMSVVNAAPIRAGSDDWKGIPSLMGCTRRLPGGEVVSSDD
jgi:hypothetical protein